MEFEYDADECMMCDKNFILSGTGGAYIGFGRKKLQGWYCTECFDKRWIRHELT